MIYIMSDLHGCYEKYRKMLSLIDLREEDTLYILGDIVDRGENGIKILLDLMSRKNVVALLGNHDHKASIVLKRLMEPKDCLPRNLFELFEKLLGLWLEDGGRPTRDSFLALQEEEKKDVLKYFSKMPLYKTIKVNGREYFLAHTVPEIECMPEQPELCSGRELVLGEPDYEEVYFEDITLVTGHTPTELIDKNSKGRIWKGNNHIAVDCGAVFGNPLGCICLDTMEEFYVE